MKLGIARRRRRDFVAELAPARTMLVALTIHRGLLDRFVSEPDYCCWEPTDDATLVRVTIAVNATRHENARRAGRRRGERLGVAVFDAELR